ncbi:stlA [Symbiodinium sp. CCMP2592]|nr:stlA [Symbiodinium sp. CCMP2592]
MAFICGTGAAFGQHYRTDEMKAAFREAKQRSSGDELAFADRIFDACGFDGRSAAPEGREEYLHRRQAEMLDLAAEAACQAVQMWGGSCRSITHLLCGTMTGGMEAPSLDIRLSKKLGLPDKVERISVENMGCLTGFRLLNVARQIVAADAVRAKVLVVVADLRSLIGNSLPDFCERSDVISACLFRDAASAAVVTGSRRSGLLEIIGAKSTMSESVGKYRENQDGSTCLPDAIAAAEPKFLSTLLSEAGLPEVPTLAEVDIACLTGGPRILQEVAQAADVYKDQMEASWAVMKEHGNLSGASNLAVLDYHLRRVESRQPPRRFVIGLAMGPGPCLEGVLMKNLAAC